MSEHVLGTCSVLLVLHSLGSILLGPWWCWNLSQSNGASTFRLYKQLLTPCSACLREQLSDSFSACCVWTRFVGGEHGYTQVLDVCLLSLGIDWSLQMCSRIVPMGFF